MRILVIANDSEGLNNFRGLLLEKLLGNHEIVCVVPQSESINQNKAQNSLKRLGCKLILVKMDRRSVNPVKDFRLLIQYRNIIKRWNPELTITYTIKPNIYAGMMCRLLRVPYVANITGLGSAFQNEGMLKKLVFFMYKMALKKVKKVFFENVENKDIMLNAGVITSRNSYVLAGAGVDLERFSYLEYPKEGEKAKFLFIGRVMREKGIEELFSAIQEINKNENICVLDVLGDFEEDYSEQLKRYENEGWLKYHGVQSDIRPYIKKCHCFVLPSWHEGMANTNLENAACGRPIITSRIHGCLEAVIEGQTGYLCESKDADSLYKTMKKFIDLPYEKKRQMGIEGRKHMESIFDKRKVVEETITVMEII